MKMYYNDSVPDKDKDNPYLFTVQRPKFESSNINTSYLSDSLNLQTIIDELVITNGFNNIHKEVTNTLIQSDCVPLDFNFNPLHIEINNFRSIGHFNYDFEPGLLWINGEIGSGKSSMLKAINYCLLNDEDPRTCLKEGESKLSVDFTLEYQGRLHRILRSWSGSQTLQYWIDDNEQASTGIRERNNMILDNLPFLRHFKLLYRSQMSPGLLSQYGFNDRINLISEILGLNLIKAYQNSSKAYMDKRFSEINLLKSEKMNLQSIIDSHSGNDYDSIDESVLQRNKSKIDELNNDIKLLSEGIDIINKYDNQVNLINRLQSFINSNNVVLPENIHEEISEKLSYIEEGNKAKEELTKQINEIRNQYSVTMSQITNHKSNINKLNKELMSINENCPTCGHELDLNNINKIKEDIGLKLELEQSEVNKLESKLEEIPNTDLLKADIDNINDILNSLNKELAELKSLVNTHSKLESSRKELQDETLKADKMEADLPDMFKSELEEIMNNTRLEINNIHNESGKIEMMLKSKKVYDQSINQLSVVTSELEKLEIEGKIIQQYVSLFSNNGAVTSTVFKNIAKLLSDDNMTVTTYRELASGETRIDFDIEYKVDNVWLNYNQLSGGQMGLVDLIFLSKLLKLSNGAGMLILDESLAHVSASMMEVAIEEIRSVPAKVIIFVTHVASFPHYHTKIDAVRLNNDTKYIVN
jgi:exonuclease SbcC